MTPFEYAWARTRPGVRSFRLPRVTELWPETIKVLHKLTLDEVIAFRVLSFLVAEEPTDYSGRGPSQAFEQLIYDYCHDTQKVESPEAAKT